MRWCLLQPQCVPSPALSPSPTDPALRANPYPEVTDPACRLPLPTLFQHTRGCSPWIAAGDMGTAWREIYTFSPEFSRASESSPDTDTGPFLGENPFQYALPFTKKREQSQSSRQLFWDRLRYCTLHTHLCHAILGDLNPTPFRSAEGNGGHCLSLRNGARPSLRTN